MSEIRVSSIRNEAGTGAPSFPIGVNVTGIVSATAFYGSGANLTGIATTKNVTVGTRTTSFSISVVGTGMTLTLRSGIGTVNF